MSLMLSVTSFQWRVKCTAAKPHLCWSLTCYGAAREGLAVVEALCLAIVVEGGWWSPNLGSLCKGEIEMKVQLTWYTADNIHYFLSLSLTPVRIKCWKISPLTLGS